jgi:hypothetical protein
MLQAHSFLWHYLWVAPNVLLVVLAALVWRYRRHDRFPVFLVFCFLSATEQLTLYVADILPSVTAENFWRIYWTCLLVEALLKFVLIAEIFARLFEPYPSVARTSRMFVRGTGLTLVLGAVAIAAFSHADSTFRLISGTHILGQTAFIIETGLVLSLFLFAAYFRLAWDRASFGIALGLGVSGSVHLATWALMANTGLSVYSRSLLDFVNMATFHICVLIWSYYLLVPEKRASGAETSPPNEPPPPELDLEGWNQELERLLHQ